MIPHLSVSIYRLVQLTVAVIAIQLECEGLHGIPFLPFHAPSNRVMGIVGKNQRLDIPIEKALSYTMKTVIDQGIIE